jgi:hypothetical protein
MSVITKPADVAVMQFAFCKESTETGSGSIEAQFMSCSLYNSGAAAVTINGQSIPEGAVVNRPYVGKPYSQEVTFDATGSTLLITVIY